ncbi:MAG: hypothetical protein L6R39_000465 [Caloplaca ligustica]|nr:MAG: hypothetical protein L6R39_000465 [Caloplaca ligustica]
MRQFIFASGRKTFHRTNVCLHYPPLCPPALIKAPEQGRRTYAIGPSLPRVAQPSLWQSIIPKFMRSSTQPGSLEKVRARRDWNPATFFIVIFLLIGSNAMQMIALKNEFTTFSRRADAKIGLLKEVIERVQKGEEVDVKGLLGTGDPEQEKEWEQVIQEIEQEDRLWQAKARRREQKKAWEGAENEEEKKRSDSTSVPGRDTTKTSTTAIDDATLSSNRKAPRGFY